MGIENFPAALQPIIQQGFLEREFEQALKSNLGYRMIADREEFPNKIGETITKTRAGLKGTKTTPLAPNTNTNLDNGLTPDNWGIEQYTLSINMYGATMDLNTVTDKVGIASQFVQNAYANGEQAARSLDELARDALFAPYFGGNTFVTAVLGAAGPTIHVDDVRGFMTVFVNGVATAVSANNPLTVVVGSNVYTLNSVAVDQPSTSLTPKGISGSLTFSGNVAISDTTVGSGVLAATASTIIRPGGRTSQYGLESSDLLTMAQLLDAVASLRANNVPTIDGVYNCHLDPFSSRQLFADPDFKELFRGATSANGVFRSGTVNDMLGLRFMPTTEAYVQAHPTITGGKIRRPIIVGGGAIIEGDFAGMTAHDVGPGESIIEVVDGIAMVTREPLDRLRQIVAQSWYWIGGFCAPSDTTTNSTTIPTASNSNFKRAVMVEHFG